MRKVKLPLTIDPIRAAQKRVDYVGIYPTKSLTRLKDSVVSVVSDVDASFSFGIDNQRLVVIKGQAEVTVHLLCQRCLQPYKHTIHITYCFSPIKNDEQAEALPGEYEPVDVNDFGEIDLLALIEDEFILALPIVPVHESEHCEVSEADMVFGEIPEEDTKPNPFAVLASLKQK